MMARPRKPIEMKEKELSSSQGAEYAAFIAAQVAHEHDRTKLIDERATKLQQGASVTLGLFVAALSLVQEATLTIPDDALKLFFGAAGALILAFFCGVVATYSRPYAMADVKTLDTMINERWSDSTATSRNIAAHLNIRTLERRRPGNQSKANALTVGVILQGIGMLLAAATVVLVGVSN